MNQSLSKPHIGLRRATLLLGIVSVAAAVLVACGGGTTGQPTETATGVSSADAKKQALAVPPGWVGRVPPPEVINGVTVPPEPPATLNNSTLAGVDTNKNGVRDDVERVMAKKFGGTPDYPSALAYAKTIQEMLTVPTPATRSNALVMQSTWICAVKGASINVLNFDLTGLTANTELRKAARRTFGDVLIGFSPEELTPCVN